MAKKINLGNLKTIESKNFTKKKVIVGNYEVLVDEVFRESKINALINEFLDKLTYIRKNNISINISDYSFALVLKYFTDIEVPNEFEKQIELLNILIDLDYLNPILESFDKLEVEKMTNKLNEFAKSISDKVKENKDEIIENVMNDISEE